MIRTFLRASGRVHPTCRPIHAAFEPADDGLVDPAALEHQGDLGTPTPCEVYAASMGLSWMGTDDLGIDFDTAYDIGVQVVDAAGVPSEIRYGTIITPNADGSPGDGVAGDGG